MARTAGFQTGLWPPHSSSVSLPPLISPPPMSPNTPLLSVHFPYCHPAYSCLLAKHLAAPATQAMTNCQFSILNSQLTRPSFHPPSTILHPPPSCAAPAPPCPAPYTTTPHILALSPNIWPLRDPTDDPLPFLNPQFSIDPSPLPSSILYSPPSTLSRCPRAVLPRSPSNGPIAATELPSASCPISSRSGISPQPCLPLLPS